MGPQLEQGPGELLTKANKSTGAGSRIGEKPNKVMNGFCGMSVHMLTYSILRPGFTGSYSIQHASLAQRFLPRSDVSCNNFFFYNFRIRFYNKKGMEHSAFSPDPKG